MRMCEKITSIRVKEKTKQQLNKLKIYHRETQEEVIERIMKPLLQKKEIEEKNIGVNDERNY